MNRSIHNNFDTHNTIPYTHLHTQRLSDDMSNSATTLGLRSGLFDRNLSVLAIPAVSLPTSHVPSSPSPRPRLLTSGVTYRSLPLVSSPIPSRSSSSGIDSIMKSPGKRSLSR